MKKIIIDVSKIVYKLWNDYDGTLSQKTWAKKFKVENTIIEKMQSKLLELDGLTQHATVDTLTAYDFNMVDRELVMTFERLNGNVYEWGNEISNDMNIISNFIWGNGLTCCSR
jgi:hypothetical protein